LLQTVVDVASEKNSTLVMPFPVELLRFFENQTASQTTNQAANQAASRAGGANSGERQGERGPGATAARAPSGRPARDR
jgi:hypothetical protein